MKEIIERLRTEANENIADGESIWSVKVTNREALQIADALEAATFPPIVQIALLFLGLSDIESDWVAIDRTGIAYEYSSLPKLHEIRHIWTCDNATSMIEDFPSFRQDEYFNLLFHRTATGWEWYGNPNKQNIEQHGK